MVLASNIVNPVVPRTTHDVASNEARTTPKRHDGLLHRVERLVDLVPNLRSGGPWLLIRLEHLTNRAHHGFGRVIELHLTGNVLSKIRKPASWPCASGRNKTRIDVPRRLDESLKGFGNNVFVFKQCGSTHGSSPGASHCGLACICAVELKALVQLADDRSNMVRVLVWRNVLHNVFAHPA